VPVRRGGLPLNEHRGGDQQHKEDRQQYRRYEPLANAEFVEIGHVGRLLVAAGAQCSQSPMTAGEARGDIEDIVTLRRITRLVATYLLGLGSSRVVIRFRRSHSHLSATGSLQHSFRCASFRHARSCQRYRWPSNGPRRDVCKRAGRLVHRQLDRSQPHD